MRLWIVLITRKFKKNWNRRDFRKAHQICSWSSKLKSNSKLLAVNGVTIRRRRKELRWSQVELSQRAGYSERVIRKAEAGGTLRLQTIKDLATALSADRVILTFHDLTNPTVNSINTVEPTKVLETAF